ncbi:putative E3 ubiquitin-protein ligase makorin-1 [Arapaima gigas]
MGRPCHADTRWATLDPECPNADLRHWGTNVVNHSGRERARWRRPAHIKVREEAAPPLSPLEIGGSGMEKRAHGTALGARGAPVCRQFVNGTCRFGSSCHFSHELPVVPLAQMCRYFQKGSCWFGERCRYQHVPQMDGAASGSRRGSVPAVTPSSWRGHAPLGRRGSEPSLPQLSRPQGLGRRGSEPLQTSMLALQPAFECLTMDIAEEEEQGTGEMVPQPSELYVDQPRLQNHSFSASSPGTSFQHSPGATWSAASPVTPGPTVARAGPAVSVEQQLQITRDTQPLVSAPSRENWCQQGAEQGGAAAPSSSSLPDEAYKQSKDVTCGICMDKVYEKANIHERRFGILPNCCHAFCLGCIVTWRKTKDFQEEVVKACPQCRVKSPFYIPSKYWVCDGEPKQILISAFKERTSKIRCSFYLRHGCCPFKSECIYRHELPNGCQPHRRRSSTPCRGRLEDMDSDSLQLLHYVIALTLLDEDATNLLDDEYVHLYLDNEDEDSDLC